MTVLELITRELSLRLSGAQPGHCIRLDDLTEDESHSLRDSLVSLIHAEGPVDSIDVRVLDKVAGPGRATVEEAVGVRNNKDVVFVLLVPPALANEASSLDNAFQRVPYGDLLDSAARHLADLIVEERKDFPASQLRRMTEARVGVEHWLDYLAAVHTHPDESFGSPLWQIGLFPDEGGALEVVDRLRKNNEFIKAVVDPSRAAQGIRERLRASGLRPGEQFERVVMVAEADPDSQNDARQWARALHDVIDIPFADLVFAQDDAASDIDDLQVQPFVGTNGAVPKSSGLVLTQDGTLECQVADGSEAHIQVKWRTTPTKTTQVKQWLIEMLPPEDLRAAEDAPVVSPMRVGGVRRQATIKLDIAVDDLAGGSLFVIRVTPLDEDDQPLQLPDGAQSESQAFEIVFLEEPVADAPRTSHAASVAEARLRAVVNGAQTTEEAHATWYWEQQQFGLTIGNTRAARISVSEVVIALQRRILRDTTITGYSVGSPYGLPMEAEQFLERRDSLPTAFARKRAEVAALLVSGGLRDVAEVFAWNVESRAVVADYLASYKRAIDAATDDVRSALQSLDSVQVIVGHGSSQREARVVLPLHPMRLAWFAAFDELTTEWSSELIDRSSKAADRREEVSLDGLTRIAPTNLPFAMAHTGSSLHVYFDELTFGTGLLLPLGQDSPEVLAAEICSVFGLDRKSALLTSDSILVADRLVEYIKAHSEPKAIRVAALNPSDGVVLASAIDRFIGRVEPHRELRIDVLAYGEVDRYANPLLALTRLQERVDAEHAGGNQNPLFPALGAAVRPRSRLAEDGEPIHVAVADGIGELSQSSAPESAVARYASMLDLLTPLVTTPQAEGDGVLWSVSPALTPRGSGTLASAIVDAHRSHQTAVGAMLDIAGLPALRVEVSPDTINDIRVLHARADWVLTLDRFVGLDFYETSRWDPTTRSYILDYAPDFIDGMSHKLTVTTAHRAEVTGILKRAMDELGLDALDASATQVLSDLMTVSGRLILRLQSSEGFARESVSLAALIAHLRMRGELEGAIVVPVDSHQEIFGRFAPGNEAGRRCDMLIVKITQRKLSIQCVEVKSRQYSALPLGLADDIVDQLMNTRALLEERFFATDPPRVDAPLQRAQLAGLLHYYADRAVTSRILDAGKVADTHRNIDRIIEGGLEPEISLRGYVISLQGSEGIPGSHRGVPISVLTAKDLGEVGLTIRPDVTDLSGPGSSASSSLRELEDGKIFTATPSPPEPGVVGEPAAQTQEEPVSGSRDVHHETAPDEVIAGATLVGSNIDPSSTPDVEHSKPEPSPDDVVRGDAHRADATGVARDSSQNFNVVVGHDSTGGEVRWAPSTKGSPHAFIVGIPGQGKSVTTRRIIRELAVQGLPSLVFDFHGDMAADPPAQSEVLDAAEGLPITPFDLVEPVPKQVNEAAWDLAEVVQFVAQLGDIQRSNVYKALQIVYGDAASAGTVPTLSRFAQQLEEVEEGSRGRNARERIIPLIDFGLFDENSTRRFDPRARGMVVDLSGLRLEQVQIAGSSFLLRRVYKEMFTWPQDGTIKLAIVLDEAHRLAGDVTLPKLMKEGRKYGVAVIVASQGLADFSADVLGNAGTKIVFRTNQPESRAVAKYLRGRQGQDLSVEIERLGVGQAYVSTADAPQARKTRMDA
jgi:DNA phosphorothioation-dependent restriction protein DptH